MTTTMRINQYFSREAQERVLNIFPNDGAHQFSQLVKFISIVAKRPNTPFVVPPERDQCLHEILAARDSNGNVLERIRLCHILSANLGNTKGKTLIELESPVAIETCNVLIEEGFIFNTQQPFSQPACTLTVLSEN